MCKYGTTTKLWLGKNIESIDSCIAPLIRKLNKDNITTISCCCGHGKGYRSSGGIFLNDGRVLIIGDKKKYLKNRTKYFLELALTAYTWKVKNTYKWKILNLIWKLTPKRVREKKLRKQEDVMNKRVEVKGKTFIAKPLWRQDERLWRKQMANKLTILRKT